MACNKHSSTVQSSMAQQSQRCRLQSGTALKVHRWQCVNCLDVQRQLSLAIWTLADDGPTDGCQWLWASHPGLGPSRFACQEMNCRKNVICMLSSAVQLDW